MATWPNDVFDFAFFHNLDERLDSLETLAEPEVWDYHSTPSQHHKPILFNYVKYTYVRLAEEEKIELSDDGQFVVFNTGLVTAKSRANLCILWKKPNPGPAAVVPEELAKAWRSRAGSIPAPP